MIRTVTRHYILCKLWKGDKEEKYIKDCNDCLRYTDNIELRKIYRNCFLKELNDTGNVSWMYVLQSKEMRLIRSLINYPFYPWIIHLAYFSFLIFSYEFCTFVNEVK